MAPRREQGDRSPHRVAHGDHRPRCTGCCQRNDVVGATLERERAVEAGAATVPREVGGHDAEATL